MCALTLHRAISSSFTFRTAIVVEFLSFAAAGAGNKESLRLLRSCCRGVLQICWRRFKETGFGLAFYKDDGRSKLRSCVDTRNHQKEIEIFLD